MKKLWGWKFVLVYLFILAIIITPMEELNKEVPGVKKEKPTRYNDPINVLKNFGSFEAVELNREEIILYTSFYPNDEKQYILEEAKRSFIQGIYLSFIQTPVQKIKIAIIPREVDTNKKHEYSFQGSIKRKDALLIAQELLNIKQFDDLLGETNNNSFFKDSPSPIFNKALYNDQGTPGLNVFFEKLTKLTF